MQSSRRVDRQVVLSPPRRPLQGRPRSSQAASGLSPLRLVDDWPPSVPIMTESRRWQAATATKRICRRAHSGVGELGRHGAHAGLARAARRRGVVNQCRRRKPGRGSDGAACQKRGPGTLANGGGLDGDGWMAVESLQPSAGCRRQTGGVTPPRPKPVAPGTPILHVALVVPGWLF